MGTRRHAVAVIDEPVTQARTGRTKGLLPGNKNLSKERGPPLQRRVASAAGTVLGEAMGELVHNILEGMRRKTIPVAVGRLLLERLVPPGRPIKLDLPCIRTADDLMKAQEIVTEAMNAGAITPSEAAAVQMVIQQAWRSCLEAHEHPNIGVKETIDPGGLSRAHLQGGEDGTGWSCRTRQWEQRISPTCHCRKPELYCRAWCLRHRLTGEMLRPSVEIRRGAARWRCLRRSRRAREPLRTGMATFEHSHSLPSASSMATSVPARSTPCARRSATPAGCISSQAAVLGVLSLVFWSLILVVTVKYVVLILRADNRGEGGVLALGTLAARAVPATPSLCHLIPALTIAGLALFYGDGADHTGHLRSFCG